MSPANGGGSGAHLSIGEVLAELRDEFPDITISKIRFLESQGLIDPERTPSGYRKFYDQDLARLRWILHQQKTNFLPLKVIKERLDQLQPGEPLPLDDTPPAPPAADTGAVEETAASVSSAATASGAATPPTRPARSGGSPAPSRTPGRNPRPEQGAHVRAHAATRRPCRRRRRSHERADLLAR